MNRHMQVHILYFISNIKGIDVILYYITSKISGVSLENMHELFHVDATVC